MQINNKIQLIIVSLYGVNLIFYCENKIVITNKENIINPA